VWKKDDLQHILRDDFSLFSEVFNINNFGHWEEGNYVLIQSKPLKEIADLNKLDLSDLLVKKQAWEQMLFLEREKRSKPRLDDKCLTSWNAIMLKGFIDGYKALNNKEYLEQAIKNANFIKKNLWKPEGNLLHNYKNGKSTINAYLEDYCFVIEAFIAIYEVTFREEWLYDAKQLTDYCLEHFYDENNQFFLLHQI